MAMTYTSLALGVAALAAALQGSAHGVGALLAAAALADTFDGRFARQFRRSAEDAAMGGELDSLSDAIVFGVVPVAAMSILLGAASNGLWWILAAIFHRSWTSSGGTGCRSRRS